MSAAAVPYEEFLRSKRVESKPRGLATSPDIAPHLFPFQRAAVEFGVRAGSWGLFFDTGLGKTACELEWCRIAAEASNGRALILTPLAVARQIEREGLRWGYPVRVIREQEDAREGINICNYDRLEKLEPSWFGAVALDEASILKSFTGKTSRGLNDAFASHRWKLAATATPAPNDHTELGQHASFLGVLSREEMLVRWFINDSGDTKSWRLKKHAVESFFDWMASWCRMAEHPRDMGDERPGFDLPSLTIHRHRASEDEVKIEGELFGGANISATDIHRVKRQTAEARAEAAAALVHDEPNEPFVVWCDTDYEADSIVRAIGSAPGGVVEVRGSHTIDRKESALAAFADGTARVLITKPSVAGFGLNWQHCARMVYVGRSFSFESYYQSVRRCWRFGQTRPVNVHLILADGEDHIGDVIDRKGEDHKSMRHAMAQAIKRADGRSTDRRVHYNPKHNGQLPTWMRNAS